MATAAHPDPVAVLAWYDGDIDGHGLLGRLTALRRNAGWRVRSIPGRAPRDSDPIH